MIVVSEPCKTCEHRVGIPNLKNCLATLILRLHMDRYNFEVNKDGYAIWWEPEKSKPKVDIGE